MRPTALQAGRRKLLVRATDSRRQRRRPRAVRASTSPRPSDRGALNGDGRHRGREDHRALHHRVAQDTRRTIGFLSKAPIAGQLLNDAGQPIAGARVAVLTRDIDDDDAKLRTYVTTDGQGRFKYTATAYASRLYQFAWASHVNDARYAANGYVTLLARASATLKAKPGPAARSASGSSSTAGWPASARGAASTSSPRAAPARTAAGARSPTARSAARA